MCSLLLSVTFKIRNRNKILVFIFLLVFSSSPVHISRGFDRRGEPFLTPLSFRHVSYPFSFSIYLCFKGPHSVTKSLPRQSRTSDVHLKHLTELVVPYKLKVSEGLPPNSTKYLIDYCGNLRTILRPRSLGFL